MLEHFAARGGIGHFWVLQNGGQGCVDLSGEDFTKDILLNDIFLDGNLPVDFKPIDMIDMKWLTCVVNHDGKVYTRKKLTNQLYNSGYFIDRPLEFENEEVDGSRMVLAPFSDLNYTVMYDKVHHCCIPDLFPLSFLLHNHPDRKSTRLNSSHPNPSRMPSSA